MRRIELTIKSAVAEIARVSALVEDLAATAGLPPSSVWPLNIALDEIISNVIHHGHTDARDHEIRVRVWIEGNVATAEIEDDGKPFDPVAATPPVIDAPLEQRAAGGLGIHIVRSLMNEVTYARISGRNRLTLKRMLAPQKEEVPMDLHECVVNGVTVLEVVGRIDSTSAPAFEERLAAALEAAHRRLVLDLSRLLYISSAGFRVLYRAVTQANESNGKLVLCGMSATVSELFAIAGFSKLFTVVASRENGVIAAAG